MKIPEEKELLELLDKTEKEQEIYLIDKELWIPIEKEPDKEYLCVRQACCLDNLAERLWEKAGKYGVFEHLLESCRIVLKHVIQEERILADIETWFCWYAKPIHRIVAALVALGRAGVEI